MECSYAHGAAAVAVPPTTARRLSHEGAAGRLSIDAWAGGRRGGAFVALARIIGPGRRRRRVIAVVRARNGRARSVYDVRIDVQK